MKSDLIAAYAELTTKNVCNELKENKKNSARTILG